jgi:hypothetical protein
LQCGSLDPELIAIVKKNVIVQNALFPHYEFNGSNLNSDGLLAQTLGLPPKVKAAKKQK